MKNSTAQILIQLQDENNRMRRDIDEIFLYLLAAEKGKEHASMKSDNALVSQIIQMIRELKPKEGGEKNGKDTVEKDS
jgi:thiamine phosphate synthase YjbQ (UPF0047 family)